MRSDRLALVLAVGGCGFHRPKHVEFAQVSEVVTHHAPDEIRIALVGDVGTRQHQDRSEVGAVNAGVARAARAGCDPCDLVVWLGDNLYPRGVSHDSGRGVARGIQGLKKDPDRRWLSAYAELWEGIPIAFLLGHADYGRIDASAKRATRELAWSATHAWTGSARNWVLPMRPAPPVDDLGARLPTEFSSTIQGSRSPATFRLDLVGFDTNWLVKGHGRRGESEEWLVDSLGKARTADATWTLVFGHHTIFSHGYHGDAGNLHGLGWFHGAALEDAFTAVNPTTDGWITAHDQLLEAFPSRSVFVLGSSSRTQHRTPDSVDAAAGEWLADQLGYGLLIARPEALEIHLVPVECDGDADCVAASDAARCFVKRKGTAWEACPQ